MSKVHWEKSRKDCWWLPVWKTAGWGNFWMTFWLLNQSEPISKVNINDNQSNQSVQVQVNYVADFQQKCILPHIAVNVLKFCDRYVGKAASLKRVQRNAMIR